MFCYWSRNTYKVDEINLINTFDYRFMYAAPNNMHFGGEKTII